MWVTLDPSLVFCGRPSLLEPKFRSPGQLSSTNLQDAPDNRLTRAYRHQSCHRFQLASLAITKGTFECLGFDFSAPHLDGAPMFPAPTFPPRYELARHIQVPTGPYYFPKPRAPEPRFLFSSKLVSSITLFASHKQNYRFHNNGRH